MVYLAFFTTLKMKYLKGNVALHFTDDDMNPETGLGKIIFLISDRRSK